MYIGETYYHYIYGKLKISNIQKFKQIADKEQVYVTFSVQDVKGVHPRFRKSQVTFNTFDMSKFCSTNMKDVYIQDKAYLHSCFLEGK